jgi:hypothetical protein
LIKANEREGRDYITVVAECVNQSRLGRIASVAGGERRCVDSKDSCTVDWQLATQDHEHGLACVAMHAKHRRQPATRSPVGDHPSSNG